MRALLCLTALLGCRPPAPAAGDRRVVTIATMNDWHATFGERLSSDGAEGGLPWLAAAIHAQRQVNEDLLLVDAGDGFQGDPMANARLGQATVEAFSLLGVEAAAVGNHEFDHGPCTPEVCDDFHPLRGALQAAAQSAPYPYLTANIVDADGQPWAPEGVQARVVIERNGVRIGILGLSTEDTPTTTKPEHVADLRFTDVVAAAEREASALRAEGADVVVALAHVTGDCRQSRAENGPDAPCTPSGELGRLLTELPTGTLDLVVAGHAHQEMQGRVGDTVFIESGSHGAALGLVDIVVAQDGGVQVQPRPLWTLTHASTDPWCAPGTPFPPRARMVGGVRLEPSAEAVTLTQGLQVWNGPGCTEVGCVQADARRVPYEEGGSTLGNVVSDAMRAAWPGSQVAIQNAGGLRADLSAGVVRQRDVHQVMPFANSAVRADISGADLLRAVEIGASGAHGPLLPAGLSYTVTTRDGLPRDLDGNGENDVWESDLVCSVTIDGAPLDLSATYSLVVSDFLLGGGDHQTLGLGKATRVETGDTVGNLIQAYFEAAAPSCVAVPTEARIVVEDCDPGQ
jgi:5'-nucleotidase